MPKVHDTRRQRAFELLRRVDEGPSITEYLGKNADELTTAQVAALEREYKLWVRSWVRYQMIDLIRELKDVNEAMGGKLHAELDIDGLIALTKAHLQEKRRVPKHK